VKRLPAATIVVAFLLACNSHGDQARHWGETPGFETGNQLLEDCTESHCLGYIIGVSDTIAFLQSADLLRTPYCLERHITQGQVEDVVTKYLQDHPADRHLAAASLVFHALTDALPCDNKPGKE